jgi:hypothetical protein
VKYQTSRRNNPEDSHLQTRRRENLKSDLTAAIYNSWASTQGNSLVRFDYPAFTVLCSALSAINTESTEYKVSWLWGTEHKTMNISL